MNSIPKEANFLAGSGGSGSEILVGGTRFKGLIMEAVGSGCLGHRELTQSLPERECPSPLLLVFVREALFVEEMWCGDISSFP